MDPKLSNQPDKLAQANQATVSLSTNVTSSSPLLLAATSSSPSFSTSPTKDTILPNGTTMLGGRPSSSERDRETNNNLKIFKNEYILNNQASLKYDDETVGQQVQRSIPNSDTVNNCNNHGGSGGNEQISSNTSDSSYDYQQYQQDTTRIDFYVNTYSREPPTIDNANSTVDTATSTTTTTTTNTPTTTRTSQQELEPQQVPFKPPANNRSILILREIEATSSESSVRDIFNSENCPSKPVHCEYALQNSWYVTFKDDEDARLALAYIRKHIVKWKGKPIMARYKPKPAVASAVNQPPPHHHIVPPMVIQQQQQQQQRIHTEDGEVALDVTDSPIMLGGPVTSVGGVLASNVTPEHQSPVVLSPVAILNHTSGGPSPGLSPNDGQTASLNNPSGLMLPYGHTDPYQTSAFPPHHHHSDGSLVHHPHHQQHLSGAHMMGPPAQVMQHPHHHHHQHPMAAGYNPYYGQQGQMIQAPWDLSTVFVYNGLSPYNKTPVSSVSLVGGAYQPHHRNHNQHIDSRTMHSGDVEQVERKHRRRRRLE